MNFSPKISGLYKPGEHINLRASYALGYKAPTIKELYYNYTGVIGGGALTAYHGNTDLKAQTSQYASIGIEYVGQKFQASLTGYMNYLHNMIELVEISVTPDEKFLEVEKSKQYKNLTKARIMVWISPSTIILQNLSALPVDIVMLIRKHNILTKV